MFFSGSLGDGIEIVQAIDEAHAVDIVQALQPGAVAQALPATLLDGKNRHRQLWDWRTPLSSPWQVREGQRAHTRWPTGPAAGRSEHEHPDG